MTRDCSCLDGVRGKGCMNYHSAEESGTSWMRANHLLLWIRKANGSNHDYDPIAITGALLPVLEEMEKALSDPMCFCSLSWASGTSGDHTKFCMVSRARPALAKLRELIGETP